MSEQDDTEQPRRTGRYLGIPYDWRRPTVARAKQRKFNVDEPRLVVPKSFGWGWDVNFGAVANRLRRRRRSSGN